MMTRIPTLRSGILLLAAAAGACAPAERSAEDVPLLPRSVVFGNPTRANVQISPDGTQLSYLAPVDGVLNVWVAPVDDPAAGRPVTSDTSRGIGFYAWAYDGMHLLYLQDEAGDENWRMYAVAVGSGAVRDLTPLRGVQARPLAISPEIPDAIVVGLNDRDPRYHDVYRIDLATGARDLLLRNDRFERVIVDDAYAVRLAGRFVAGGAFEMMRRTDTGWAPFAAWELDDSETTFALEFTPDGDTVYMQDSRGRNTAALTAVSLTSGERRVLAEDPQADLSTAIIHPRTKRPQAAAFTYDRVRWQVLDSSVATDWDYLSTVADGDLSIVSRTLDDRHWIVGYENAQRPDRVYLYDRDARTATFLFTNREDLAGFELTPMHSVFVTTGDGLTLVSYLSLPPWSDADGDARPEAPVPLVLVPHGGPWYRDTWGLNGFHQWLANRGYGVLAVNFRGSTGFGKDFINASTGEWAGKMHDDLLDAVAWAVAEGVTHPDSVAIMGGSYGGYATLVGMTFTPDVFACGVDIVGPSNLVTLLESFPPYWGPRLERWVARIGGDHRTPAGREFLLSRSPISRADSIRRPLLIGQGANDPRVNQAESDQLVAAMEARGIPVTYALYPDEGHGFGRPENAQSFFAIAEAFLGQCLGGRVEPIGDSFTGSSLTVPAGAEHVPGLAEAIGG